MSRLTDGLIGLAFNEVVVVGRGQIPTQSKIGWLVRCALGHEHAVPKSQLHSRTKCVHCRRQERSVMGQTFGNLRVIGERVAIADGGKRLVCRVVCSCGREKEVPAKKLKAGLSKTCAQRGCDLRGRARLKDLSGRKIKHWTVLRRSGTLHRPSKNAVLWLCRCDCGNERELTTDNLRRNEVAHCGCLHQTKHPLYKTAIGILRRTKDPTDPGYKTYGALTEVSPWIEPEWDTGKVLDLANGLHAEIGTRPSKSHSVDRKKVHLGYVRGNLRWATIKEQAQNRRPMIIYDKEGKRTYKSFATNDRLFAWVFEQPEARRALLAAIDKALMRRRRDERDADQGVLPLAST